MLWCAWYLGHLTSAEVIGKVPVGVDFAILKVSRREGKSHLLTGNVIVTGEIR